MTEREPITPDFWDYETAQKSDPQLLMDAYTQAVQNAGFEGTYEEFVHVFMGNEQ